jgi:hypothetical protein
MGTIAGSRLSRTVAMEMQAGADWTNLAQLTPRRCTPVVFPFTLRIGSIQIVLSLLFFRSRTLCCQLWF